MGLANFIPLALEGQWFGWAAGGVVITAFISFVGTVWMLLWSDFGAKKASHIIGLSFFGVLIILSAVWLFGAPGTIPGTGPRGTEPEWIPFLAESEQGRELAGAVRTFPTGTQSTGDWDKPGKKYPGGIDSAGELDSVKLIVTAALAHRAEIQGLGATDDKDWDFRNPYAKAATEEEQRIPSATSLAFRQQGTPLLFGVTIPASPKHPEITVFAYRDKGKVFLPAAIFFAVSVLMFALHTLALSRIERREAQDEHAAPTPEPVSA